MVIIYEKLKFFSVSTQTLKIHYMHFFDRAVYNMQFSLLSQGIALTLIIRLFNLHML